MSKKKIFKIVWFTAVIIFFIWNWSTFQAKDVSDKFFKSENGLKVSENEDLISFEIDDAKKEVIFFPGGLVDPDAYVPLARDIADKGFTVHIVKMPWRMSIWGYEKINELFTLSDGKKYILGGHSQGAKMAAQYVYENPGKLSGLFLLGTSHPRDVDMSTMQIPTLKIYGEFDGLASVGEVMENKNKLPANTELVMVSGGNHSQFGNMGHLLMDDSATITREKQQEKVLDLLIPFLNEI